MYTLKITTKSLRSHWINFQSLPCVCDLIYHIICADITHLVYDKIPLDADSALSLCGYIQQKTQEASLSSDVHIKWNGLHYVNHHINLNRPGNGLCSESGDAATANIFQSREKYSHNLGHILHGKRVAVNILFAVLKLRWQSVALERYKGLCLFSKYV